MTDKPTQTTETPKQSIGNYIALGYLNILIFYLFFYRFLKTLANDLFGIYNDIPINRIQDYKILIGFCTLYAIYSIIIAIFDNIAAKSLTQKTFWNLFVNNYILFLPPVTFLFCILYCNKEWGFSYIICFYHPSIIFIESVFVSLFLIPIILLALFLPAWINPYKYRKQIIDKSKTKDQHNSFIRFCSAYRHSIIGGVLYRFLYLIFPATLLFLISEGIEHRLFEFYILIIGYDHILFILFVYIVFSILMRRLYAWMAKNVC